MTMILYMVDYEKHPQRSYREIESFFFFFFFVYIMQKQTIANSGVPV